MKKFTILYSIFLLSIILYFSAKPRENFSIRRHLRRHYQKPFKRRINNHIDTFKNNIAYYQSKYL